MVSKSTLKHNFVSHNASAQQQETTFLLCTHGKTPIL